MPERRTQTHTRTHARSSISVPAAVIAGAISLSLLVLYFPSQAIRSPFLRSGHPRFAVEVPSLNLTLSQPTPGAPAGENQSCLKRPWGSTARKPRAHPFRRPGRLFQTKHFLPAPILSNALDELFRDSSLLIEHTMGASWSARSILNYPFN